MRRGKLTAVGAWHAEWGAYLPELTEIAESGYPLPIALCDQPDLFPGLRSIWGAYCELTTTRVPNGAGQPGPIPWTAIERYAHRARMNSDDEFQDFVILIRAADQGYLRKLAELARDRSKEPV